MRYLVLAQSEVTARALGAWLELLGERSLQEDNCRLIDRRCVVVEPVTRNGDQGMDAFETVVDRIAKTMDESAPLPLTVLVDSVKPNILNPLSDGGGWDSLLAMLILAVPEVRWVFGVISENTKKATDWDWHKLPALLAKPWRNPLLDPTGLRNHVRANINEKRDLGIPKREQMAAAIDEEVHYALFHAYTAYRFGYRTDAVTSWRLMETLFAGTDGEKHGFNLLLEDVNLYFPDRPENTKLANFQLNRATHCRKLGYEVKGVESSDFRVMVTTGHSDKDHSEDKVTKNKNYLRANKKGQWAFVLKPTGGMFDLWSKAHLFKRLVPGAFQVRDVHREGLAPKFVWPPEKVPKEVRAADTEKSNGSGHSAPGKLMLVASHLVRRADSLRTESNTVEECIRGALLATEALELLAYRTPTLALQALELKQWFETKAEVAFVGVGHHFRLARRFEEIERETWVAARFYDKSRRHAAALDAGVTIANRMTLVFREAGQFDEEEECLRKLRWWNRKLSFRRALNRKHYLLPGLGILAYAEWLISSLGWLLLSVLGWLLVIALAWWTFADKPNWHAAVQGTVGSFIGSSVASDGSTIIVYLSTFSALLGFFHLGVFVSFLYSAIARK